jgi:hypothetical protein
MITRKAWQLEKKKYGIPDRVIRGGSFGEKMEKLQKRFDSLGLRDITDKNAKAGLSFADDCDVLLDEWLAAANKRKTTDFKDRAKAIAEVESYKVSVDIVRTMSEEKLNPIGKSKKGWRAFQELWTDAVHNPDDIAKLHTMYSQGIRNALGKGIHDAHKMKDVLNLAPALSAKIAEYEKIATRWNKLQESAKMLADDATRAKFWTDMKKLVKLATDIIKLGAP